MPVDILCYCGYDTTFCGYAEPYPFYHMYVYTAGFVPLPTGSRKTQNKGFRHSHLARAAVELDPTIVDWPETFKIMYFFGTILGTLLPG